MIEYRKATANDTDCLAKIRVDFLCDAKNISTREEKDAMYKSNKQFLFDSLSNGSFIAWIATDDGKAVATSGISLYALPPNKSCPNGKVAYISNMYTYPEYRKQGIASKLFTLTVAEAKNWGCKKVLLNATDMGRPIYEKFGFKDTSNDMIYYIAFSD